MHLCTIVEGQYYGMKFAGIEHSLDQRSGLNLTPDHNLKINGNLDLEFYLRFEADHESYFGYIFRLILGDRNIDLIHGVVPGNPNNLELILDEKTSDIAFQVPLDELRNDWLKFRLELDFEKEQISLYYNDRVLVEQLNAYDQNSGFRLMFGANSFGNFSSTDVPNMIIRDVQVKSGKNTRISWPLNETDGTIAHSFPKGNDGIAINPEWWLKNHNTWNQRLTKQLSGEVKTAFDSKNDDLYLVSSDSLHIYNLLESSINSIALNLPYPIESSTEIIFDTSSNNLLMYSLDYNYMAVFDKERRMWSASSPGPRDFTVYWHHNRFIGPNGSIVGLGGYGQYTFKNSVLLWNPEKSRFDSISYQGDFNPRYLAGAGFNPGDSLYYIIGGYGSESGKQSESPDYYYEVIRFSLEDRAFSTVHKFQDTEAGFCFANSIVFDNANNLYALYFPKYQFDNQLQLIKVSLENPDIIELGNAIDFSFLDINSNADLYYSQGSNSLYVLSSYISDGSTQISINSIAFPPQAFSTEVLDEKERNLATGIYFLVAIIVIGSGYFISLRRKSKKTSKKRTASVPRETTPTSKENSIILFGGFQVIDRDGNDITGQFTPLPKKLFLFILLHSLRNDKGVSSNTLYETFWFEKSVESARNNRAVNIVKLKSLLDSLDTAAISKDTGYWKFDFDPVAIHIDYYEFLQLVRPTEEISREQIVRLLAIIENNPFLYNTNADWLDPFKSEVSNGIIDTLFRYIHNVDDDPEFLLHLTKCIFQCDTVSEEALKIQCRLLIKQGKHSLAQKAYSNFLKEYEVLYCEAYSLSFKQVIEEE
jgi:two-component SAPR family response regulator